MGAKSWVENMLPKSTRRGAWGRPCDSILLLDHIYLLIIFYLRKLRPDLTMMGRVYSERGPKARVAFVTPILNFE
jgi:hypothetical protein